MGHTPTGEGGDNPTIMSVSHTSIDEGGTLTTSVSTLNQDTRTYYLLEGIGITAADFSSGSLMLEGTGNFTFAHTIANDSLTEGAEYLKIQLFSDSERKNLFSTQLVEINDTSTRNSKVTTENGKVIGPTQTQYDTLQGKIPNVKGFKGIDKGSETTETRDIFILPNIDREFLSKTYTGDRTGESWYFNTGETDSNDIFLIDSKVDIKKVAQFANCIWYNPNWQGDPLIDTRRMVEYDNYPFSEGDNSFEMAYYSDWERPAPTLSQFGTIDLSKIDLGKIQGMSDDEFIETYKSYITAYIPESELGKDTFNPSTSTYTLTPSATTINEGAVLTTTVATTGVKTGTTVYYSLSGTGIDAGDFSKGALLGSFKVGAKGPFKLAHTIKSDIKTEGDETLEIKLFSDSARTKQVGSTASLSIADSSTSTTTTPTPTPTSTYTLTPSATTINEGAVLTTTVATTGVKTGTTVYYSLSGTGIDAGDFSKGALLGSFKVGAKGPFKLAHTIKSDLKTEGDENLEIKLFSDAARTKQVGSTTSVVIKDTSTVPVTSVYDFKILYWNNIALGGLFGYYVDIDSSRTTDALFGDYFETEKASNIVELLPISRNVIKYSQDYKYVEYDPNLFKDGGSDVIDIRLSLDSDIRVNEDFNGEGSIWVGNLDSFNRLANSFREGIGQIDGKSYERIILINEINLLSNTGLKSISRKEADLLADKLFTADIEYRKESSSFEKEEDVIQRSFRIRQFNEIDIWLKDGLFVVDSLRTEYNNYETPEFASYSVSRLLTLSGVHLGSFEDDYEYKYDPEDEQYRSVEINLKLYELKNLDKNITDRLQEIFPEEYAALSKTETAPIFGGYSGTQLGFDWLTSLPTSNESYGKEIVSLLGANSAIFGINQVYLALEDCDIVTGAGKDLIILADDINNSEGTVPRIHDFEVGQDKILIPAEVFAGFGNSPAGKLANSAFTSGITSGSANGTHRVIYDTASGNLYHDSDGTGTEIQQLIATLTNKPILSAEDLLLG